MAEWQGCPHPPCLSQFPGLSDKIDMRNHMKGGLEGVTEADGAYSVRERIRHVDVLGRAGNWEGEEAGATV